MARFTGKKALVIGGSRGIGASIVQRLAGEGASVTFTYAGSRDAAEALAAETGSTAVRSDASDRDALIATVSEAGAIDILVVSAGLLVIGDPLELDPDAIDRMIDVNVRAPYFASVEAARSMPEGGRIIVIGSTNGDRMPFAGGAAYALTKSAIQGMARGLARDFGPRGITVNVVQPGPVDTRDEPCRRRHRRGSPRLHGAAPPRQAGRNREPRRMAGERGSRFRHRRALHNRRRLRGLTEGRGAYRCRACRDLPPYCVKNSTGTVSLCGSGLSAGIAGKG